MFWRATVCCLLVSSTGFAQLEKFDVRDLGKWAMFAQISQEYEEFSLTSEQVDALHENQLRWIHQRRSRGPGMGYSDHDYLAQVYAVLNESQQQRLHQVMFQRWMNEGNLAPAIRCFVDEEVSDLDTKLGALNDKIEALRDEIGLRLESSGPKRGRFPEDINDRIIAFQKRQWKEQTAWLAANLGQERSQELVGKPYPVMMMLHLKSSSGGMMGTMGPRTNPATGETIALLRRDRPKRPVDIPEGWTLAQAEAELEATQTALEREINEGSKALEEDWKLAASVRGPGAGNAMRQMMENRRKREQELKVRSEKAQFEVQKLKRIVEVLGGDPEAEAQSIRKARGMFHTGRQHFACNGPDFLSHLAATAEQCDALDRVWDRYRTQLRGGMNAPPSFDWPLMEEYHDAILSHLNEQQAIKLKQLIFRRLWFSEHCDLAFSVTKLTPTSDQFAEIDELKQRLDAVNAAERRPRFSVGRFRRENREWLQLEKEFSRVLAEIAGDDQRANQLLGERMEYPRNWKRPVTIPAGMTLSQAEALYREKAELLDRMKEEGRRQIETNLNNVFSNPDKYNAMQSRYERLTREVLIYSRIVEELGGEPK